MIYADTLPENFAKLSAKEQIALIERKPTRILNATQLGKELKGKEIYITACGSELDFRVGAGDTFNQLTDYLDYNCSHVHLSTRLEVRGKHRLYLTFTND